MKTSKSICESGFTLVELIFAISLGLTLTIIGATALNKVQDVSTLIAQRSDMQQNGRSAFNFLATDISLAGTGMPVGGISLPANTTNPPTYGSLFSTGFTSFHTDAGGNPFLFSADGRSSAPPHLGSDYQPEPLITITYEDSDVSMSGGAVLSGVCKSAPMVLDQVWASPPGPTMITDVAKGVNITFNACTDITDPADPINKLQVGDVLKVCAGQCAVGVITALPGGNVAQIQWGVGDTFNFNQPNSATGRSAIQSLHAGGGAWAATATRIKMVTYYLDADAGADGKKGTSDDVPPFRLMRRVNTGTAIPLAENIVDLIVTYDQFDDLVAGSYLPRLPTPTLPATIRNVNMTINLRSSMPNARGVYQFTALSTSVAPRNLSYRDRYK